MSIIVACSPAIRSLLLTRVPKRFSVASHVHSEGSGSNGRSQARLAVLKEGRSSQQAFQALEGLPTMNQPGPVPPDQTAHQGNVSLGQKDGEFVPLPSFLDDMETNWSDETLRNLCFDEEAQLDCGD